MLSGVKERECVSADSRDSFGQAEKGSSVFNPSWHD